MCMWSMKVRQLHYLWWLSREMGLTFWEEIKLE